MPEEEPKSHNVFLYILLISCAVVIATSFYFFYFKKDYNFIVETACDNTKETCFYRDCSIDGECPPNNLSYYNQYTIKARDFSACVNEDCTSAIQSGAVQGEKTECTEEDITNEVCVAPEPAEEEIVIPVVEEVKVNKKK
ncbi:MAG: hypothetical protein KBD48_00335 [Candidatus Pacebacteria bacterium]|nr:hypothetical protein [Candidatus Paceibacterota bacterium]